MNLANFIPVLSGSLGALLGYFVLVLCIDIAFGVVRGMVALWKAKAAAALTIKSFDWNYLTNFAKSQLLSPPILAIAGALLMAPFAPDAAQPAIYAAASAVIFAQSLVLSRDIFNKIREVAGLVAFRPLTLPSVPPVGAK